MDVTIDESLYPLPVVYRACYTLTGQYFVWLHRENDELRVRIWPQGDGEIDSDTVGGVLANTLIDEALRYQIASETLEVRATLVGAALKEAGWSDH